MAKLIKKKGTINKQEAVAMKKVITMCKRGLILICLAVWLLDGNAFCKDFHLDSDTQISSSQHDRPQGSIDELYRDALKTILLPYVQEAVTDYYEKNTGYSPMVDLWVSTDIISFESPNTHTFVIKFEVLPFLGAHNSIGLDHITLKVSYGEVKVEKYEHIKDYPIPPWLQRLD